MYFVFVILLGLSLAGCATTPVYNPLQSASTEVSFNENAFKSIQTGMTMEQVHQSMGSALTIGYEAQGTGFQPVTVPNPYRSETIPNTGYVIEYYLQAVHQPDGAVSDDELLPLIFKDGKLTGRGWPLANSIRHP